MATPTRTLLVLALAGCTGDTGVSFTNVAPTVSITQPLEQTAYGFGADLELRADITDDAEDPADLEYVLTSDRDGTLGFELQTGNVEARLTVPGGLSTGVHQLRLQVIDFEGESGEDLVRVAYLPNAPPQVSFIEPSSSGVYLAGDPLPVRIQVSDDSPVAAITLEWSGAASGQSGPEHPDATGLAELVLPGQAAGSVSVSVRATDASGAFDDASITVTVLDDDADNDGFRSQAFGGDDCDDTDVFVFPGADERCNLEDDDCDGDIDEGVTDPETWYLDSDGDGAGDASTTLDACEQPAGYVFTGLDCDDADADVHPGAPELCNGADDDCDGITPTPELTDADADGSIACADCDDADATSHPGAAELCDGVDNDCDGAVPADETTDVDGDGYWLCEDCDDSQAERFPGNPEVCDGLDNDCDHLLPANESDDGDLDGAVLCEDCDDGDEDVHPGAPELCDAVDQDCNGDIDDGACPNCSWHSQAGVGGTHTYQFCRYDLGWHAALNECNTRGYKLARIDDLAENNGLHSVITPEHPKQYWLGAADEVVEGSWGWADGSGWDIENWESSEPSGGIVENCLTLNLFMSGRWNDADCGLNTHFICELDP